MRLLVATFAILLSTVFLTTPASAVDATVSSLNSEQIILILPEGVQFKVGQRVSCDAVGLAGTVVSAGVTGEKLVAVRLDKPLTGVHLGDTVACALDGTGSASAASAVATAQPSTVVRIVGSDVWVCGPEPDRAGAGSAKRDGKTIATLTWRKDGDERLGWHATWNSTDKTSPRLGDEVEYRALPTKETQRDKASARPKRAKTPSGSGMLSGDDPDMRIFQFLATHGALSRENAAELQGRSATTFTRDQLTGILAATVRELADSDERSRVQEASAEVASQLAILIHRYRDELINRGAPVDKALEVLDRRGAHRWNVTGTVDGVFTPGFGDQANKGFARGTILAGDGRRTKVVATVSTEGTEAYPAGRRRSTLDTAWFQYEASRHLTVGVGRAAWRLGSGLNDMLWSDNARPPDGYSLDWRGVVFGRPIRINQHFMYWGEGGGHMATLRRYEYSPLRGLTLAANEALITDRGSQAALSNFMPLYFARFTSGAWGGGGHGNYIGSLEANWQAHRAVNIFGELMVDDFDFDTGSGPKTAQRIGWQGGFQVAPPGMLPGTSYRGEVVVLPNPGTYVGQSDKTLGWDRAGWLLGHPYGQDSAGYRFAIHQRVTPRLSVDANAEQFRQLRRQPVELRTTLLGAACDYSLFRNLSLGFGVAYEKRSNIGGITGNDDTDTSFFMRARASY